MWFEKALNMFNLAEEVAKIIGKQLIQISPLTKGVNSQLYRITISDGQTLVAKVASSADTSLLVEARMLQYLETHTNLPVPHIFYSDANLLLMDHIEGNHQFNTSAQIHAADLLAELHCVHATYFGFYENTRIGGLYQPNPPSSTWIEFFITNRLLYMAQEARNAQKLPITLFKRIERFATRLDHWLTEPLKPSLVHGDVWSGNVLSMGNKISGFLDPAIYYGHPETELAFIKLFNTFSTPFFQRYQEIIPIADGFFEERCPIYNLYPLLVHVRLFGGGYIWQVESILRQFGY